MKDAVKALVKNEQGEILVLFRSETHPSLAHDIDLPGGEVDIDESLDQALIREIYEETGLTVEPKHLRVEHSWHTLWGQRQTLYTAHVFGQESIDISWEHKSYEWMSPQEFANYQAIDEFMHGAQDWIKSQVFEDRKNLDKSLVSQPAF